MEILNIDINQLVPYEHNPRHNDSAVEYVAKSIKSYGFKVPLVIDVNNVIVCGHTRYLASRKLGLETVPCIVADDLNEKQLKEFRLVDNKVSEFSEWNIDLLNSELLDLDLSDFGFLEIKEDEEPAVSEMSSEDSNFDLTVKCESEEQREELFTRLSEEGLRCIM